MKKSEVIEKVSKNIYDSTIEARDLVDIQYIVKKTIEEFEVLGIIQPPFKVGYRNLKVNVDGNVMNVEVDVLSALNNEREWEKE